MSDSVSQYLCDEDNFFGEGNTLTSVKCCDCHELCMETKSCCINYNWFGQVQLKLCLQQVIHESITYKDIFCEPLISTFLLQRQHSMEFLPMVTSCEKTNQIIPCSNTSDEVIVPVLGSDYHLYVNEFCATCNSIYECKVTNISVNCKEVKYLEDEPRTSVYTFG